MDYWHKEFLLTNSPAQICSFLNLPPALFDGETAFTMLQLFDIVAKSDIFFHKRGFRPDYFEHYKRIGRPMFQEFGKYVACYDGAFEADKDNEAAGSPRKIFFDYLASRNRQALEDDIFEHFGLAGEGERQRAAKSTLNRTNLSLEKLFEWFPEEMSQELALHLLRQLKGRYGYKMKKGNKFEEWIQSTSEEEIRQIVGEMIEETLERANS